MNASLIITTYNWPEALRATLLSVCGQSVRPFEVIVADDGSRPDTAEAVQEVLAKSGLKWRHVRHSDQGIRQARVKNLGVKYSQAPYLIFIDHDVVLHRDFVGDHLCNAQSGIFLQGKRTFLPRHYTEKILKNGFFIPPSPSLTGLENRKNALRSPRLGRMLSRPKKFQTSLRGCNFSIHRDDFMRVDGYDETFDQLWGREDSDICYRLFHCGLRVRNLWFSALQYHLYHKTIKGRQKDRLDTELEIIRRERRVKAIKGFSQLSSEGEVIAASR
jgi:glycosyltransferase involved in cell wall biosynthesis